MALLSIKRQVFSATVKPPEKPNFRISVTAPSGNSGQSITLPIAITDVFGLSTELSNRPLTSYVDQIVQAANSVRELADLALQAGLDTEISNRIDAILNILFLLESKADLVGGFIPTSQIPAVAITEYLGIVDDESEMLTLTGQRGDWCQRDDLSKAYILIADDATQPSSWKEWPMPVSPVTSINGQVGVVVLGKGDIGLGNVPNIDATKRENHTGTQPASSITGLATVATSGSYDDLSNKPAVITPDYVTPTVLKNFTNTIISTPPAMAECLFDSNFVIPANTLVAGDVYFLHAYLVARTVAQVAGTSLLIVPYVNEVNVNGANASLTMPNNGTVVYELKFYIIAGTVGVDGSLTTQGLIYRPDSVLTTLSSQTANYNTTQPIRLNFGVRTSNQLNANSWLKLRSARLQKLHTI